MIDSFKLEFPLCGKGQKSRLSRAFARVQLPSRFARRYAKPARDETAEIA
jgi:hypothetical protein